MKKKKMKTLALVILLSVLLMQGCGSKADPGPSAGAAAEPALNAETAETAETGDGDVTDDPEADERKELEEYFLGDFEKADDGSTLSIAEKGDGTFRVDISIFRLCNLENGEGTFRNHVMTFDMDDPNGESMTGRIFRDSDNSLIIEITDSTWNYLPVGERLEGFVRKSGAGASSEEEERPIGVYDSGMGGLIVLETLVDEFPGEDFVFIADNAHVSYGTKSSEQIEGYNLALSEYLMEEQDVKAICIACNTASANSKELDKIIKVPLIKAIGPTAAAASEEIDPDRNNILILATNLTTSMGVYEDELDQYYSDVPHEYYSVATQNFVTMVEEGRYGTEESLEEVRETLKDYLDKDIDKIVLGCTHFPKLAPELSTLFPDAELYSAGPAMASLLRAELGEDGLNENEQEGSITLITTGDLEPFIEQTSWFKYADQADYMELDLDDPDLNHEEEYELQPAA